MHNASDFAEHFLALLKNDVTGVTGVTAITKPLNLHNKTGTCDAPTLVHVQKNLSRAIAPTCTNKGESKQQPTDPVTCGTPGTSIFAGGVTVGSATDETAEWHAIFAELKWQNSPDWMTPDRWSDVLTDSKNFLSRWGQAAHQLGWTVLDLFGVHPTAPAARVGCKGLVFFIEGGVVLAITDRTATIRRPSGALLTFERSDEPSRVLISAARSIAAESCGREI